MLVGRGLYIYELDWTDVTRKQTWNDLLIVFDAWLSMGSI